ncbi:MAG: dTDP-4-dehydrorhamnose 3,5-epimerase [Kiritimatiellaceae bacterium]|nr:dTDP-4-dehydrorhamnose 3,5-epimerase [Kiritimatiellaceae bacterium]|tara:strand:- start:636 stop:1172 length:537 start_codon:yes stop_codon:yes gene_type:complete
MNIVRTSIEGCLIIEPQTYADERGFFLETFHAERYKSKVGINFSFVQDNFSRSSKGVLRGLHFQKTKPQGKLVRVVRGEIFDVAVDIRKDSPSYGKYEGVILSEDKQNQFWIPPGFAHGFLALSDLVDVEYKCTEYYDSCDEGVLLWNDPDVDIQWPSANPLISGKDAKGLKLADLAL